MKLRLGRKHPFSIEDIEREAQAEIDKRVSLGKPPPEEWKGLAERAGRDVSIPGRPTELNLPAPPPRPAPAPATAPAEATSPTAPAARKAPAAPKPPAARKAPPARKAAAAKAPAAKAPAARKAAPKRKP